MTNPPSVPSLSVKPGDFAPAVNVHDYELVCPLCHAAWREPASTRRRGSCPRCGAGNDEMFRALTERYAKVVAAGRRLRGAYDETLKSASRFKGEIEVLRDKLRAAGVKL